jgi:hypothetical protein
MPPFRLVLVGVSLLLIWLATGAGSKIKKLKNPNPVLCGGGGASAKEALEGISTVDLTGQNTPAQAGQSRRGILNRLQAGSGGRAAAGTAAGSLGDTIAPDD